MSVSIKKPDIDDIVIHAREMFPGEACGLLAGRGGRVSKVYRMTNSERRAGRYAVPLKEQFEAVRRMRAEGTEMIGIYHSHPDARPYPSSRDIGMAMHPGCSYVIVSLSDDVPKFRSFRIIDGRVEEESVDVG